MRPIVDYANRRRVGVLVIPDEIVAPEEIRVMLDDPEVQLCQHRIDFQEVDTPRNRESALSAIAEGVRILGRVRPHAVVFACTSGGVFGGSELHEEMLAVMRSVLPGIEVCTAADAVCRVLLSCGARRIVIGSPYSDHHVSALIEVLDGRGIEVLAAAQLFPGGYPGAWTVNTTNPLVVGDLARKVDEPRADAVFVSCTGLPSAPVIAAVEAEIGKPIVTSNLALVKVLKLALGLGPSRGFGSILEAAS
jgi:maleate isomerase